MVKFYTLVGYLIYLKRQAAKGIAPPPSGFEQYKPKNSEERAVLEKETALLAKHAAGVLALADQEYKMDANGNIIAAPLKPVFPTPREERLYAAHIIRRVEWNGIIIAGDPEPPPLPKKKKDPDPREEVIGSVWRL